MTNDPISKWDASKLPPLGFSTPNDQWRMITERRQTIRSVPIRASTWRDYRDGAVFFALLVVVFAACFWFA